MSDIASKDPMPVPVLEQRDDMGRLVGVTWQGMHAGEVTGSDRWLVAVDGSACSLRAVEMAARMAAVEQGAGVDLIHVQSWLTKEAAETELARRGWAATAQARQVLDAAGVQWRLMSLMGEEAPQIVRVAQSLGSRGIALGSRGLTATESALLGSVAYKVVHLAKSPVLLIR
ncbi:MAG: universal stress protein [Polaromonas sp.]|uniref:universal stress protein n=1 Tax=Polaromonas sp. TaxID=1869339 RepID=UPI002731128B|nr:universal stress protein [Polaromonas sp.]MDP1742605.1 universal stress protein [Polaromonas sp.]MDP3356075.1 universal stress protein [Polaromonas sp.]